MAYKTSFLNELEPGAQLHIARGDVPSPDVKSIGWLRVGRLLNVGPWLSIGGYRNPNVLQPYETILLLVNSVHSRRPINFDGIIPAHGEIPMRRGKWSMGALDHDLEVEGEYYYGGKGILRVVGIQVPEAIQT